MAEAFSVVSWTVEHLRGGAARRSCVAAPLNAPDPQVLALNHR